MNTVTPIRIPAIKTGRKPLRDEDLLTATEKKRIRMGLPLEPRPDMRDLLQYAGTFPEGSIMTNDEIEGLENHE